MSKRDVDWARLGAELDQLRGLKAEVMVYLEMFDAAVDGRRVGGLLVTGDSLTYALERVRAALPPAPGGEVGQ